MLPAGTILCQRSLILSLISRPTAKVAGMVTRVTSVANNNPQDSASAIGETANRGVARNRAGGNRQIPTCAKDPTTVGQVTYRSVS